MKANDHGYFAPLTYDVRVRERLLGAGLLQATDLERYLGELPELEAQAEALGIEQPALGSASAGLPGPNTSGILGDDGSNNEAGAE